MFVEKAVGWQFDYRPGPLVRIGPTQVSFYSLEIYKAVHYPGSTFVKDPQVYSQFVQDGYPAFFSITYVECKEAI